MTIRNYIKFGLIKSLVILCVILQVSSCSSDGGSSDGGSIIYGGSSSSTVNWIAPVARADDTPLSLSEIGGYRIYYGTTAGDYPNQLDIQDGTALQATLTIPSGVYYYVITTYDVDGRESAFSIESEITI